MTRDAMTAGRSLRLIPRALVDVLAERARQDAKWGQQDHPDGTGPGTVILGSYADSMAERAKWRTERSATLGTVTFEEILTEEWAEAVAEDDPVKLRAELVQVAAVAVQWVEAIDRRIAGAAAPTRGDGS